MAWALSYQTNTLASKLLAKRSYAAYPSSASSCRACPMSFRTVESRPTFRHLTHLSAGNIMRFGRGAKAQRLLGRRCIRGLVGSVSSHRNVPLMLNFNLHQHPRLQHTGCAKVKSNCFLSRTGREKSYAPCRTEGDCVCLQLYW